MTTTTGSTSSLPPLPDASTTRSRTRTRTRTKSNHLAGDVTTLFSSDSPFFHVTLNATPRLGHPSSSTYNPLHSHPTLAPGESPQLHGTPTFASGFSPRIGGPGGVASPARFRRLGFNSTTTTTTAAAGVRTSVEPTLVQGLFALPGGALEGEGDAVSPLAPASEIRPATSSDRDEAEVNVDQDDKDSHRLLQEELDSHLDTPSQAHHHPLSARYKQPTRSLLLSPGSQPTSSTSSRGRRTLNALGRSLTRHERTTPNGGARLVHGSFEAVVFVLFWMSVVVFFSALFGVGGGVGSGTADAVVKTRHAMDVARTRDAWSSASSAYHELGHTYDDIGMVMVGQQTYRSFPVGGGGRGVGMGEEEEEEEEEGEIILEGFEPLNDPVEAMGETPNGQARQVKTGGSTRGRKRAAAKAFFGRFGVGLGVGGPRAYGWEERARE